MFDPLRPVVLVLALALAGSGATAQQVQLPAPAVTIVQAQAAGPALQLDVPQPPKALDPGPPKSFPMVPQGVGGKPLPESPPTSTPVPIGGANPAAPCDFRFFMNNQVSPAGASQSASTLEPNIAISRDTAIYTGNFFAARSLDSGMTWTHMSPYTRFPARDAGFCCDQRTVYVPSVDMTFWLLEYRYSATTQTGGLRVAFTRGRGDFRNDVWNYFDITPATFGQAAGSFLDFSDIAYGSTNLYGSAIIARGSDNTALGLVAWRANLLDIFDLGGIGIGYYTTAQLGGFGSYRFAQGAANTMYWAAHTSTTNLRVYSWGEGAPAATLVDRTVAAWSGTPTPAAGPDGRDWTGFGYTVNAVLGGYANAGEMGFLWTSGAVAGRPQCFVRVARLRTSDVGLIAQHDIWSNTLAFHFPTCATNAAGDVGGTFMYGGGGFYPSTAAFVIDPCAPNWAPLPSFAFAAGARGPSSNRTGDYLGAGRHSGVPMTFVGSGFALDAGGTVVPRYVWFGREQNTPGWVDAAVSATDDTNTVPLFAAITVTHTDRFGSSSGSTPFSRSYPPRQAFQVTAPQFAVSGGSAQHLFDHWVYQGNVQPTGARTLSVDDLGTGPRTITARAVYSPAGWSEVGDAGATPAAAQAPLGAGALAAISGAVGLSGDLDYYLINVVDEASFSASTIGTGPTLSDTQLFLFDASGSGVVCNDDEGGSARSRIDSTHVTANGCYFLAVSGYNRDPANNGLTIFPNTFTGQQQPTPGRGPANGDNALTSATGTYAIVLTGCEYAPTTFAELGDAGELPHNAQAPCKVGPLTRITGSLGATDADMFKIQVDAPAAFVASCCANTAFDSQLFLFAANGLGVVCNDDNCGANSRIDSTRVTTAGTYYLAISRYDRDPSSIGGLIFANTFTGQIGPTGPGGALPVTGWSGVAAGPVAYEILLAGCSFAASAGGVDYGTGAGSQPGVPSLTTTFPPQLGNNTGLTLTNPDPTALGFALMLGQTRTSIPFVHGTILVGDIVTVLSFPAPAVGANPIGPITIPNVVNFCGQRFAWQAFLAVVPTSGFPHGLTLTNGTEWTFGL